MNQGTINNLTHPCLQKAGVSKGTGTILIYSHQKPTAFSGLWHGGWPIPCGHWRFAYVCESHVQFYGVYDEAGMYVSLFYFFFLFMKCGRENGPGFKFHQQITTIAVCERTAKVREAGQKLEAGSMKFPCF
jgi:hypothetical protein